MTRMRLERRMTNETLFYSRSSSSCPLKEFMISTCTKVFEVSGMSSPSRNLVSSGPDLKEF